MMGAPDILTHPRHTVIERRTALAADERFVAPHHPASNSVLA
jgi:hypothetical protein